MNPTPSSVKNEVKEKTAEDAMFEEWARNFIAKPVPVPPMGSGPGLQVGGNTFFVVNTGNTSAGTDSLPAHCGIDSESCIGRFTYHSFKDPDTFIPCLFRNGEKYCCVRMCERRFLRVYLAAMPPELIEAINIKCYPATQHEAKLLTHINTWHSEGLFGTDPFTVQDMLVKLEDMQKFHDFLVFAHSILENGGKNVRNDFRHCGFVRVNNDSLIPYTNLSDDERGVPLFYFEGQIDILKKKGLSVKEWELAYLKVCCKVQGVRKELIAGSELAIVTLTDLKGYFPKRSVFVDSQWAPSKNKSLLPKHGSLNSSLVPYTRWTTVTKNETFSNYKVLIQSATAGPVHVPVPGAIRMSNPTPVSSTIAPSPSVTVRHVPAPSVTSSSMLPHGRPLTAIATPRPQITTNPMNGVVQPVNGIHRTLTVQSRDSNLSKLKVQQPPMELSVVSSIPEYPDGAASGAFAVNLIILEKDSSSRTIHCVNMKPFKQDVYLLVLKEFMNHYFPNVSIYPTTVSVLKSVGIVVYLPNSSQIRVMNNFGFAIQRPWEMPLILAAEAHKHMPRLRTLFRVPVPPVLGNNQQNYLNGYSSSSYNHNRR